MSEHFEKDHAYHQSIAAEYDAVVVAPRALTNDLLFRRFGRLVPRGTRMLDLACGTGHMVLRFGGLFQQVAGVDHSPAMLAIAEQKARAHGLRHAVFEESDVFAYLDRCASGSCDFVCCVGFLHHVPPDSVGAVLSAIHRVLVPHGLFLFSEPIQTPPNSVPARIAAWNSQSVAATLSYSRTVTAPDEKPLDAELLVSALGKAGLAIVKTHRNWEIFPHHEPPTLYDRVAVRVLNCLFGRTGNVFTVAVRKV